MSISAKHIVSLKNDISCAEVKPFFKHQELTDLLKEGDALDKPLYVICITGVFRSGKSFLLNLLTTYLDYITKHGSDEGWENQTDIPITGGRWAKGQTAVTTGIWMWMYPKPINGKTVLLMDCQGTGDNRMSSPTLDNLILFLGLQLCDLLILNVNDKITSDDLLRLNLCAFYAEDKCKETVFEHLMMLIRNWELDEAPDQLQQVFQSATALQIKRSVSGIMRAFRSVQTSALCPPGKSLKGKSEADNITVGSLDTDFALGAKKIFKNLTDRMAQDSKFTGEDLVDQFRILSERPVDAVRTPKDEMDDMLIRKAFESAKIVLDKRLSQALNTRQGMSQKAMDSRIRKIFDQVIQDVFLADVRVQNHASVDEQKKYAGYFNGIYDKFTTKAMRNVHMEELNTKLANMKDEPHERDMMEALMAKKDKVVKEEDEDLQKSSAEGNIVWLHAKKFFRMMKRIFT